MTFWTLIRRSLVFHARSHAAVALGAAVGSAVLIGALVVGDSVRWSLRRFALERLGSIQLALASNDRFFREALAKDLMSDKALYDIRSLAAMQLLGTANNADGTARANRVQVLGVDEQFWNLSDAPVSFRQPAPGEVILNERLAAQLKAHVGDSVVLRVPKPSQLSRDAPISPQEDSAVAMRLKVSAVARDAEFGRFSLQANQVAPFNAFVDLASLQTQIKLPGRANLILVSGGYGDSYWQTATGLRQTWQLADAELELRELPDGGALELRTSRIFVDAPVGEAAMKLNSNATGVLTYFVNELRAGEHTTPYSMVTASGAPLVPADMRDDEILISPWLAVDLRAQPGDELALKYFTVGTTRKLEERTNHFRVRAILPAGGRWADRELMPEFPGIAKADNCRDWDAGFPLDTRKIREKDEKYWHDFRGTPKAFVTLAAGQKMWANRFGNLTAVRFPLANNSREKISAELRRLLDPALFGLSFQTVRAQAAAASEQSFDFGQLFLGFSFFLIVAALLLMALLFQFGVERRTSEVGTLLALGFLPRQVRRLLLLEGCALASLGSVAGVIGGVAYARAMLHGLTTIWHDAVGTNALRFHAEPQTLVIGAVAGAGVALLTIWLALRKQARQPARELLTTAGDFELASTGKPVKAKRSLWLALGAGALAVMLIATTGRRRDAEASEMFFSAGSLLLIAGLALCAALLAAPQTGRAAAKLSVVGLGVRNATRRRKRSLATIALLACGSFLVVAVGAFRLDPNQGAQKRASGTGGFALFAESSLPVFQDLNTKAGRDFYGLDAQALADAQVVPLRVRDGDDASCLNLNRAQTPRLLGVRPDSLQSRGAFMFAEVAKGQSRENGWNSLAAKLEDGAVPALADEASILWALGKKVGDTLDYTDERGRAFKLRLVGALANSILQGSLLIAEEQFVAHFPNEGGYRMFLIDAPSNAAARVGVELTRALRDTGLEVTTTTRRLAEFNAVQNSYLSTFQILGGLGLLLGSVGLGVVVLRNVLERRGELAVLLAVGFQPRALKWLVMSEHGALLLLGLGVGAAAAVVAILPTALSPGSEIPYTSLALTLGGVLLNGAIWTWLATLLALRGKIVEGLRNN
ncbi:MAG: FtsX-like permease family protein [Verrucomicrobia bacterium]|nr:FtsX-like permease family protein [Verrucomicrobiota bacterium]